MKKQILGLCMAIALFLCTGCSLGNREEIEKEKEAGIQAMKEEKYEEALKHFDESLKYNNGKITEEVVDTCYYKAAAQYNLGNVEEAQKQYTAMMKYDKKAAMPCYLRGSVYLKQGKTKKAIADYRQALSREADNYEMYILIYRNLKAAGETEQADAFLKDALSVKGKQDADYIGKARVYTEMGEYEKAQKQMKKIKNQDTLEVISLEGEVALAAGEYEKALSYFQQGLKDEKGANNQSLLKGEIIALEYTGQFAEAKKKMEAYTELFPTDEQALREQIFLNTR